MNKIPLKLQYTLGVKQHFLAPYNTK